MWHLKKEKPFSVYDGEERNSQDPKFKLVLTKTVIQVHSYMLTLCQFLPLRLFRHNHRLFCFSQSLIFFLSVLFQQYQLEPVCVQTLLKQGLELVCGKHS